MNRKIKAVVFDLDDTLYPEESFRISGFRFVASKLREKGFMVKQGDIIQYSSLYKHDLFDRLISIYKLPFKSQEIISWYRNHTPNIKTFSGVKSLLRKLGKEYKIGLLTDYYHKTQLRKIDALKIKKYFDAIICTEKINAEKPSTKGFQILQEKLHCGKHEVVYVADNEIKDFYGANKMGYYTIKFNNPTGFYKEMKTNDYLFKANFEIDKLNNIFDILKNIEK